MKGNKCSVLEDEYKLRKFLSILLGIILGSIAVFIVETIGHLIFPPPAGIDVTDPEQLKQVIEQLPIGALIFVLLAWAIGSFVGGYVTSKVAKTDSHSLFPYHRGRFNGVWRYQYRHDPTSNMVCDYRIIRLLTMCVLRGEARKILKFRMSTDEGRLKKKPTFLSIFFYRSTFYFTRRFYHMNQLF